MESTPTRRRWSRVALPRRSVAARAILPGALALAACGLLAAAALGQGQMRTLRLGPELCKTTSGGKFVPIPGFPGERIDRRLLRDVRWMVRTYKIFITDGFSMDPVHAINGEHPLGLALDIVPNKAKGGSWRKVARLARWAEPRQNDPRAPFRWVGWNGDANHGRGHHLHLSWAHSPAKPGKPARVVYTRRCPIEVSTETEGDGDETPPGGTGDTDTTGGGTEADPNGEGGVSPSGGKQAKRQMATGGVRAAERRHFARLQATGPNHD